jgi:hypothetical protein
MEKRNIQRAGVEALGRSHRMRTSTFFLSAALFGTMSICAFSQEPPQPNPPPLKPTIEPPQPPTASTQSSPNAAPKKLPFFLIMGTVFNENALAFPGVEVRIRRTDEKKFRWEGLSNSRGEFAVRVPDGYDYSLLIRVKHYQDETREITTKAGDAQQRVTIRMQLVAQEKAGAKK